MRKLMWFTIGFAAACAAGAYWLNNLGMLLVSILCLLLLVTAAFVLQSQGKPVMLFLFGCIMAFLWVGIYNGSYVFYAEKYDGQTLDTEIEISDYSTPTQYGISADGSITLDGRKFTIRIYSYTLDKLNPGDILHGETQLLYTGAADWATALNSSGIQLVGYVDDEASIVRAESVPLKFFAADLRKSILGIIDTIFPSDTIAFARALLLGDTSLLTYETDTALSLSGIRHVVAVSGLHVSILFSMVYALVGYRKVLTPAIGLPLLLLFAALAGFTPSVVRACIMQTLMISAMVFDRDYDPPTALSFAVLAMLIANPQTVCSVSLQMSVGCMVGIFLFSGRIQKYFMEKVQKKFGKGKSLGYGLLSWIINCSSITLSTMVTVTPLSALYFKTVSLISILTNLMTMWVVTIVFCGIIGACILSCIWLPLGKLIAWLLSWLIRYVLVISNALASFPLAAVYTQSMYIVMWLVLCYVLLTIFLLSKKKQPLVFMLCIVLSLCAAIGASWIEPRLDDYRMTVLDVGQGQCILLQNEERYYVIDCGGDYAEGVADLAAQTLLSQGVTEIDGLILTHYDKDHAGSAEFFLSHIQAKQLYLPDIPDDGTVKTSLAEKWEDRIIWIRSVHTFDEGDITLLPGNSEKTDNESGLCILCQIKNCDILITGDRSITGENALLEQIQLPDLEVLVAGHHGSAYATGFSLLSETKPDVVLISVGENNRYHHPAQEMLDRLPLFGCQVLRTDENGTIVIRG